MNRAGAPAPDPNFLQMHDALRSRWKAVSIVLNLGGMFLLLATLALVFLWPEHLIHFGLQANTGRMLVMQEISALLLLGAFQQNLSPAWQRTSLVGSFVVLAEAALMGML